MFRPVQLLLVLFCLATLGCSDGPKTVLAHTANFHVQIPEDYALDEQFNPNTERTSTWFRTDGRALLAIDTQPMAGARKSSLLELGKRQYLGQLAKELEHDLSNHLKVFKNFDWQLTELKDQPVLEAVFETDHEGVHQEARLLVAVCGEDSPTEVMVDYRFPEEESKDDKVWMGLMDSVRWTSVSETPAAHGEGEGKDDKDLAKHTEEKDGHH